MKIGLVLPSVPGYSETFFRSKIEGLQSKGVEVHLFVKDAKGYKSFLCPVTEHPRLVKGKINQIVQSLLILSKMTLLAPKASRSLYKIAKAEGYSNAMAIRSVIVASSILPHKLNWLHFGFATTAPEREFIGKAIGAKVAVSFRGFDVNQFPLIWPGAYDTFWPFVDKAHGISDYLIQKAYALGMSKETPTQKITPALDPTKFEDQALEREKNSFLLVSRLHWIKAIDDVLRAFHLLNQEQIEFKVYILGEGGEEERLKFICHLYGLDEYVHFLGKQSHTEIAKWMNRCEYFIQYSHQEGFCNALLEAQSTGLLCIASDADGLKENVIDKETGWIVPKRDPERLAVQLKEVMNTSEADKKEILVKARERIVSEFTLEAQQKAFLEFYELQATDQQ